MQIYIMLQFTLLEKLNLTYHCVSTFNYNLNANLKYN